MPDAPAARALLLRSAEAHGHARYHALREVTLGYDGAWAPVIGRLQPLLVDQGHRGRSTERIALREGSIVQDYAGPLGRKRVDRRPGTVEVGFGGIAATDEPRRHAAALVADGYMLFPLGPPWLLEHRALSLAPAGRDTIETDGTRRECEVLSGTMTPGLGFAATDRLALWIGVEDRLMHRVRFGLGGFAPTRGAVAEVDAWDHADFGGLTVPRRWRERLLRPAPLRVHDWWLTALALDGAAQPTSAPPA